MRAQVGRPRSLPDDVCEELAFRGVLHALGVRVLPARAALVVGASVFGAWHVAGAMAAPVTEAGLPPGMSATALAVVVVVGVTVPGGVVLAAVRRRTGSLLAPARALRRNTHRGRPQRHRERCGS